MALGRHGPLLGQQQRRPARGRHEPGSLGARGRRAIARSATRSAPLGRTRYRPSRVVAAWQAFATTFQQAFPSRYLDLQVIGAAFPPIDESGAIVTDPSLASGAMSAPTRAFIDYAVATFPERFLIQTNGLSAWGGRLAIVNDVPAPSLHGYQMYYYVTGDPACRMTRDDRSCDATVLRDAVNKGLDFGSRILEIYRQDVENTTAPFQAVVSCASQRLNAGSTTPCP